MSFAPQCCGDYLQQQASNEKAKKSSIIRGIICCYLDHCLVLSICEVRRYKYLGAFGGRRMDGVMIESLFLSG
jgi:hypothetical protein